MSHGYVFGRHNPGCLHTEPIRLQDRIAQGDFARSGVEHHALDKRHLRHKFRGTQWDRDVKPAVIDGAEWQAGVSPGSEKFHVLLNGEPVLLAIAASALKGWVIRLIDPPSKETERLNGYVEIVPGD